MYSDLLLTYGTTEVIYTSANNIEEKRFLYLCTTHDEAIALTKKGPREVHLTLT